jgi:hypothetical protein
LLLFYIASGFTGKSFAYLMLVFVAALLYVGCGVLLLYNIHGGRKKRRPVQIVAAGVLAHSRLSVFYTLCR